jgi:DNA-binding response OmpR family regulator
LGQEAADRPSASLVRSSAPSVLLAEHDGAVADMLARYLVRDGLTVRSAPTPEQALAGLAVATETVAVLDLTMPDLDPRRVRRALRAPVVFLVAPGPRPRGLSAGSAWASGRGAAPRWLTRPFGPRVLVAAVRDLLRETSAAVANGTEPPSLPSTPGLTLDAGRRMVVAEGREVPLTSTEFAILGALLASPGRARSRRQLLAAAGRKAEDRAADVYITQLRAKIGIPGLIRTIRGTGYAVFPGGQ